MSKVVIYLVLVNLLKDCKNVKMNIIVNYETLVPMLSKPTGYISWENVGIKSESNERRFQSNSGFIPNKRLTLMLSNNRADIDLFSVVLGLMEYPGIQEKVHVLWLENEMENMQRVTYQTLDSCFQGNILNQLGIACHLLHPLMGRNDQQQFVWQGKKFSFFM